MSGDFEPRWPLDGGDREAPHALTVSIPAPAIPKKVEDVARAIFVWANPHLDPNHVIPGCRDPSWMRNVDIARIAIKAMGDPTTKMCRAACNALKRHVESFTEAERVTRWPGMNDNSGWRVPNKEKHRVRFQAMIDEALK